MDIDSMILNAENYMHTALELVCERPDIKDRYVYMSCLAIALGALSELDLTLS